MSETASRRRSEWEFRTLELEARLARAVGALQAIIDASDQCRGHRACGHSVAPWSAARAVLAEEGKG